MAMHKATTTKYKGFVITIYTEDSYYFFSILFGGLELVEINQTEYDSENVTIAAAQKVIDTLYNDISLFRKSKSDYDYSIYFINDNKIISIIDRNRGRMSVTNNIENVVSEIAVENNLNPNEYLIIYKDSEGMWDGWEFKSKRFIRLNCNTERNATERYISIVLQRRG